MSQRSPLFERLFSLQGKTALVTGASGGIGRALALALAEAGAVVGLHGTRVAQLEAVLGEVEALAGKGCVLPADVSHVSACRQLVADAHARMRRLDILVNCAGINRRKPIRDVTEEDFETILAVNLRSVYFLSQAAHPLMAAQGGGKILNIGSVTTTTGVAGVSVYGVTKSALGQLTRTMAWEWARDNIQVNCLAPGFMETPLTAAGLWGDAHRSQWLLDRIAARRPGQPEELVGAALLLVSPASSYITGALLNVDGGFLAGGSWLREDE
jgi:2-deoxy-D-gluconate 3-dehydrogenase